MHSDGGIAEHGLGPRGRHGDENAVLALDRILEVPQLPLHLDLLHFEVGDCSEQFGVPVDQPLVLVDEALAIKLDEDLEHRAREALVHGEALARPVARGPQPLQLIGDGAARFRLPGPHPLQELLTPERAPARLLALHQLALDHHLGGDAGVIGAGLPEHIASAHALEAGQHVLQRIVERMPHVQRAGDVGRRDDDAERLGIAPLRTTGSKRARLLPSRHRCAPRPRRAGMSFSSLLFRSAQFAVKTPPPAPCQRPLAPSAPNPKFAYRVLPGRRRTSGSKGALELSSC